MAERQGLRVMIEQTAQFINENPSTVVISRGTRTDDGAGGHTDGPGTPLGEQILRIVPHAPNTGVETRTASGEVVTTVYSILGLPTLDIKEGDTFPIDGVSHEVVQVLNIGGYETRAEVSRRG